MKSRQTMALVIGLIASVAVLNVAPKFRDEATAQVEVSADLEAKILRQWQANKATYHQVAEIAREVEEKYGQTPQAAQQLVRRINETNNFSLPVTAALAANYPNNYNVQYTVRGMTSLIQLMPKRASHGKSP